MRFASSSAARARQARRRLRQASAAHATARRAWTFRCANLEAIAQPVGIEYRVAKETLGWRKMAQKYGCTTTVGHLIRREEEVQRLAVAIPEHAQVGVQAAFRASDRPRPIPSLKLSKAGRGAVRIRAVHHQGISLSAWLRRFLKYPGEDAQPGPAGGPVLQGLVGAMDCVRAGP